MWPGVCMTAGRRKLSLSENKQSERRRADNPLIPRPPYFKTVPRRAAAAISLNQYLVMLSGKYLSDMQPQPGSDVLSRAWKSSGLIFFIAMLNLWLELERPSANKDLTSLCHRRGSSGCGGMSP